MKLLIDARPSYVIFCDYDKASYIKNKDIRNVWKNILYIYKRRKIYLDEFIPQLNGTEIYCDR